MAMATTFLSIGAAVGIRNGTLVMPNTAKDLATVTGLFDRIPVAKGGSAEIGGVWASERSALIAEVTAQIIAFQTLNRRPVIDGVIDPTGGTLKLMNQLAMDPSPTPGGGVTATVAPAPSGLAEDVGAPLLVAEVGSLSGTGPLGPSWLTATYTRRLIQVEGSSIKWFGALLPRSGTGVLCTVPHIHFTPTPIQGGYHDATYGSFGGWGKLWDDYTSIIGGQVAASGADQILIIPFYKTSQYGKLGTFLDNWQETVAAVATAAIDAVDPLRLRDRFTFDRIVSSSFSNGWVTHQHFNAQAREAAAKTSVLFDLDGSAASPPSNWRPPQGIAYLDRTPLPHGNPVGGNQWYVGGRWKSFAPFYGGRIFSHAFCRNHLLFHGLWQFCT